MRLFLFILSIFYPLVIFAQNVQDYDAKLLAELNNRSNKPTQENAISLPPSCEQFDLRKVLVGTQCTASENAVFELIVRTDLGVEIWEDHLAGVYWSDLFPTTYLRYFYSKTNPCSSNNPALGGMTANWSIPTSSHFETGIKHGIAAVLPRFSGHKGYYATNEWIDYNNYTPYFEVATGSSGAVPDGGTSYPLDIRCIGFVPKK